MDISDILKQELQNFRPGDEIQIEHAELVHGYLFIPTASHGYLAVAHDDPFHSVAVKIADFGYIGRHAVYLEEDSEAGAFLKAIGMPV